MPSRVPPIATIPLARSIPRLLARPVLMIIAGGTVVIAALVGLPGQLTGYVLAAVGGVLVLAGLVAAIVFLSVRLDVEEAIVRVRWLGGQRAYPLARGPVTRVRLRGEGSSSLRPNIGAFGWGVGTARLRGEEEIHVVRLAPTSTAILIPTELGRLAIAAASEPVLLDALGRAARARQRLEELAARPPVAPGPELAVGPSAEAQFEPERSLPPAEPEPRELTGIERARLAAEAAQRAAAGADGGTVAEPEPAAHAEPPPMEVVEAPAAPRRGLRRPSVPRPRLGRPRVPRRPAPSAVLVLLPLVGAGVAWGIGQVLGTMPPAGTDIGRVTALALVLAGPGTTVGAIMARAWWPRLVGVVVTGGLLASLFIGRALVA